MSFEELENQYKPLIAKYARWNIPGYAPDDIAQEVRLTLWKCQQAFDPETRKGFNGRPSSFLNYLITSIENTLGKAPRRFSQSYYQPVTGLECMGCGGQAAVEQGSKRQTCKGCGGKRWRAVHGGSIVAIDPDAEWAMPAEEDFSDSVVQELAVRGWLSSLPADMRADCETIIAGGKIPAERVRAIRKA